MMAAKIKRDFRRQLKHVSAVVNNSLQDVIAFQNSPTTLTIIKNDVKQIVFSSKDIIVDHSLVLSTTTGTWELYIITETGNLFLTTEQDLQANTKSCASPNQAIFTDLLGGGGDSPNELQCQKTSLPVVFLDKSQALYHSAHQVVSLCTTGEVIAITSQQSMSYLTYLVTEVFRTADLTKKENVQCVSSFKLECKDCNSGSVRKHFVKFVVSDSCGKGDHVSSDWLYLSDQLYLQLFGQEICLMNSPTLIYFPPESSSVYFQGVRTIPTEDGHASWSGWQVFCDVGGPVVDVIGLVPGPSKCEEKLEFDSRKVRTENSNPLCSAIAIVSSNGSFVIQYHTTQQSTAGSRFSKHLIPGPVLNLCGSWDTVYHVTKKCVFQTKVSIIVEGDKEKHTKLLTKSEVVKHISLTDIVESHKVSSINDCNVEVCVVGCDMCGKMVRIYPEEKSQPTAKHLQLSKQGSMGSTGSRMKNLMFSMDQLDVRREANEKRQELINYWLVNLNLASVLIQGYLNQKQKSCKPSAVSASEKSPVGVTCSWSARLSESDTEKSICLDCQLTNNLHMDLDSDWGVIVTVAGHACSDIVSRSMKFTYGLKTGSSIQVSVPVDKCCVLPGMKVTVSLTIETDLSTQNCDLSRSCDRGRSRTTSLVVPVNSQEIDILFFLLPGNQRSLYHCQFRDETTQWESVVEGIAMSRPAAALYSDRFGVKGCEVKGQVRHPSNSDAQPRHTGHTGLTVAGRKVEDTKVDVCVSVTEYIQQDASLVKQMAETFGQGADGLLKYLLKDSGLETLDNTMSWTGDQCSLVTMSGHKVHLNVSVSPTDTGQQTVTCQVRSSLSVAAAVRRALTIRLQALTADTTDNDMQIEIKDLFKKRQLLMEVEQDLNMLQRYQSGVKQLPWKQVLDCIGNGYQKLKAVCF